MNLKYFLPFLIFTISFAFGQGAEVKDALLDKTLKKDSVIAEFSELYELTNTIHPGQFMFCSKKEFDKTYLKLKKSIQTDLSLVEYYQRTATLMAKIKDGHTAVDRNQITSLLKQRNVFPFSIYTIKGRFYLDKSSDENKELIGLRILKINGKDIHSVVKEIQKYLHLEGENESGYNMKFRNFPFYYFIYNQTTQFTIEYVDENNKKRTTQLQGIPFETFTKVIQENREPLSFEFRNDQTAILTCTSFENGYNEEDRKNAEHQLDAFFAKVDSLNITNLILDLRNNGGGSPDIGNYLFSYLTSKPYYYFDYIGAKFNSVKAWKHYAQYPDNIQEINSSDTKFINGLHCFTETDSTDYWWFEKQQNKANYFKGKLSVLINGGCFSTTGHLLALLREYHIGTFYGEYSQGSNYSNSGGQAFRLPYSKTLVWIPTFQYKMRTPHFEYDSKGIQPDIEIHLESSDLKTKFDRQMDFLLKQIELNK